MLHTLKKAFTKDCHCAKSVRIQSYSGPYFPVFSVRMRENMDQNNSEYGHFSRSVEVVAYHKNTRSNVLIHK